MAKTTTDVLNALNLLSWDVIACGCQRGWVTTGDISRFATSCLSSALSDEELTAVAELASAEKLSAAEVNQFLSQLSPEPARQECRELDCWRLAMLIKLQSQDLGWDEKVTRLEEVAAEFGHPVDMRGCSRYSTGASDPLDEMERVIVNLRDQLGVG